MQVMCNEKRANSFKGDSLQAKHEELKLTSGQGKLLIPTSSVHTVLVQLAALWCSRSHGITDIFLLKCIN